MVHCVSPPTLSLFFFLTVSTKTYVNDIKDIKYLIFKVGICMWYKKIRRVGSAVCARSVKGSRTCLHDSSEKDKQLTEV